jgi:plastocyanin
VLGWTRGRAGAISETRLKRNRTIMTTVLKLLSVSLLAALPGVAPVAAGTITGTVRAQIAAEAGGEAGAGAYASRRYKFVERVDYEHLRDFVIYIDQPIPASAAAGSAPPATMVQRDASFEPHVLPIAVGTTVRWPNDDDIYHNIFSMSETKSFDLGYYKKEKTPEIVFDHVGRVDVFCAIHTKMHCIILVLPNRFFALADARGHFVIEDVPAGTYRLTAWQERMPPQTKEITVPAEGGVKAGFVLGLSQLPKY